MKMFLQYLLWFCLVSAIYCGCAQQSSCEECTNLSACYWCDSSNRCQDYYGEKFSGLLCPNQWVQHRSLCTTNENTDTSRILNIIKHMKNYDTRPLSSSLTGNSRYNPPVQPSQQKNSNAADAELKELLRKLMLLKLLRKMKTKGSSSLTSEDRELLSQLTHEKLNLNSIAVPATATITTTTKSPNVNNKIKHLLSVLEQKAKTNKTPIASISKLPTIKSPAVENSNKNITRTSENTLKPTDSVLSLLRKVDEQNAGIVYEENKNIGFPRPSVVSTSPPSSVKITDNTTLRPSLDNFTVKTTTSVPGQSVVNYCKLYEEVYICNSDSNCTWCNTRDICIKRSGVEYKACVAAKDQMVDKEFGLDKCLAKKHCKECVENDKCYWCDVSKSCHTYPFLGYVPQTCGGDWYVKQCDVQLAVILIVLPLIIILLAMVTFYFCLKYCYYRRKVLRVPLFEKPGVFDYRKDKKVYYVNPEDESSDTEMAAEKIRKKYRLPVEREPLIDPNS